MFDHVMIRVADRGAVVDEFHRVALAAGFRDNGAPGLQAYRTGCYGSFALDPDGNNVEAVPHRPAEGEHW